MSTKIFSVANQKGGVGKTTTAVNLSACLAEKKKRVLLVDLDPQANATSGLGFRKEEGGSIYDALLNDGGDLRKVVQKTPNPKLDLIASELDMTGAEIDLANVPDYLQRLGMALEPMRREGAYDYVLLDCPPSLGILTMNALCASDGLVIPMQCEYYALEGLADLMTSIKMCSRRLNRRLQIEGIVLTMYDGRMNLTNQVEAELRRHLGDKVYQTVIPRSIRLSEAPSHGVPGVAYDKTNKGSKAYLRLAEEFAARSERK